MLGDNFYKQVQEKRVSFLVMGILTIIFTSGITFTFVIPTLKGFEWFSLLIALLLYFLVANIFIGVFKDRLLLVFISSLILSALGMGLRIWLEWGEYSLIEHMNPVVLIVYPCIIALITLLMYLVSVKYKLEKPSF